MSKKPDYEGFIRDLSEILKTVPKPTKTKKPNYKKALQGVLAILETEPEPTDNSSKSSETTKGVQDITQESSEIAYQFTDHDLTVYKNSPDEHDTDEKVK